jgi:hypothetical protein
MAAHGVHPAIRARGGIAATTPPRWLARAAGIAVAAAMFACAMALWTLVPGAVLWAAPRFLAGHEYAMALTLAGVVVAMGLLGSVLARLNRLYCRLMSIAEGRGRPSAWRRPLCNDDEGRLPTGVLDRILVSSVMVAIVALVVWWVALAECTSGSCY